ncbi:MAG: radical SAM protein [Candidatus Omnitrophica bacterium]|nr:radical SAM protein [Candidatus Omnitrophota bacterium]
MTMEKLYIQWHITRTCNMRCRHCYQDSFASEGELGWDGLVRIADGIISFCSARGLRAVINLTGGEPFLKREFFQLAEYLNRADAIEELMVITNGMPLSDELHQRLSGVTKLSTVKISLEGVSDPANGRIRPKGSWSRVVEHMRRWRALDRFAIVLMFTVSRTNMDEVPRLFDFCVAEDLSGFIIERFIPLGQGIGMRDQVLDGSDWRTLVGWLTERCEIRVPPEALAPYKAFWVVYVPHDGSFELRGAPCIIGDNGFCIMEDGEVFPCRRLPVSVGNLLKMPVESILASDTLTALHTRERLGGECARCGLSACLGCRAIAYALTGDLLGEDPQCLITR